jgi:hypothetical protein
MKTLAITWWALFVSVLFAQVDTNSFQTIYQSKVISASVEKVLYQTPQSKHFFIHYQIKNLSQNNLGIYTDAYFGLFYPNQWGVVTQPQRNIIDERRIDPAALKDSMIRFIEDKYKNHQLHLLLPGETLDYYRDFNASHKKHVQLQPGEFMFISTDGQLLMTDGSKTEHAHFDAGSFDQSCIFLPYPLVWKKIPTDSKIYYEN